MRIRVLNKYKGGDWNAVCDTCGFTFYASELVLNYRKHRVCMRCWDPRNPQDFVRAPKGIVPAWFRPKGSNELVCNSIHIPGFGTLSDPASTQCYHIPGVGSFTGESELTTVSGYTEPVVVAPPPAAPPAGYSILNLTYDGLQKTLTGDTFPIIGTFNSTGTLMIGAGLVVDNVLQNALTTPWDASTIIYDSVSFNLTGSVNHVQVSSDGLKLYQLNSGAKTFRQYTFGTAYDVSTLSDDVTSVVIGAESTSTDGFTISDDESKLYISDKSGQKIDQYTIATPKNISTSVFLQSFNTGHTVDGITSNPSGSRFFVLNQNADLLYQLDLSTNGDITTAVENATTFDTSSFNSFVNRMAFGKSGEKLYLYSSQSESIRQYSSL
jgi:hypothetical protein